MEGAANYSKAHGLACLYREGNKGLYVLLSRSQAGPGRTVKQEQEETSRNHVQTFISPSVCREGNRASLSEERSKVK